MLLLISSSEKAGFSKYGGKTRSLGYARHWNEETTKEHETMGFHDGWNKAADQLEELARSL